MPLSNKGQVLTRTYSFLIIMFIRRKKMRSRRGLQGGFGAVEAEEDNGFFRNVGMTTMPPRFCCIRRTPLGIRSRPKTQVSSFEKEKSIDATPNDCKDFPIHERQRPENSSASEVRMWMHNSVTPRTKEIPRTSQCARLHA